ncbi:hypothetical protein [Absidia glauca]|uniref:Uncharacterized protein n=1 Tax=Absidia glauca TaxID=4829 RepID=A0A168SFV1_ABSGL|nr:hypothetical protein [Absidia glauca]
MGRKKFFLLFCFSHATEKRLPVWLYPSHQDENQEDQIGLLSRVERRFESVKTEEGVVIGMALMGTRIWEHDAGSVGVVLKGVQELLGTVLLAMEGICGLGSEGRDQWESKHDDHIPLMICYGGHDS